MILRMFNTANMVNKMPGPSAFKEVLEKIVVIAAIIDRTQLFIATALADLPGLESTRYTEDGANAHICPNESVLRVSAYV